jgi:hypothetical protein
MTLEEVKTLLAATNIPVSFSSVPLDKTTARPYICFFQEQDANFAADGIVYYSRKVISVRLYTDTRDETNEAKVETALKDLYWSKSVEFLNDEKIYEVTYQIEV